MDKSLNERREAIVREHIQAEIDHDFDTALGGFTHPHYELMATGQSFDGPEEVLRYYKGSRESFPDQRAENVRYHFSADSVITEFDLCGTNTGPFLGQPPTGKSFSVPMVAIFFFDGDIITNERIYFDSLSIARQIGQLGALAAQMS